MPLVGLATAVARFPFVRTLDLWGSTTNFDGALADAVRSLPLLEDLWVTSDGPIDAAGAETFGCMPNLRDLRLMFFGCVAPLPPGALDHMPRLRFVHLFRVDLSEDHVASLGRLTELDYLDLDGVADRGVYRAVTMALPQFRDIRIERNRFIWAVEGVAMVLCSKLLHTDTGTGTGTETTDRLGRPLLTLKCLRMDVVHAPDDRTLVSDILGRCPGLRSFTWIPKTPESSVLAAVGQLSNLQHLSLEMQIASDDLPVLARSLRGLRNLEQLWCPHIQEGSTHSADAFGQAFGDLAQLSSIHTPLWTPFLARAVGRLSMLVTLTVELNDRDNPLVAEEFIRSLDLLTRLHFLKVKNVGPTHGPPLAVAIGKLVKLKLLRLEDVHFTAFAEVGRLVGLECLILCGPADSAFVKGTLAGAICGLTRLKRLLLPTFPPDADSVAAVAEALAPLVGLQALHMHLFDADVVATIARRCLAGLTALVHLDVGHNRLGRQEALAVAELAAPHLKALKLFDVQGNGLTVDDLAAVTSVFGARDDFKVRI
jgi:hypothetical protein